MIYIGVLIIVISPPAPEEKIHTSPFQDKPKAPKPGDILMTCDKCGWENVYQDISKARRGIAGHRTWCGRDYKYKGS